MIAKWLVLYLPEFFGEGDHDEQNRRIAESVPELFDRDAAADGPE